MTNKIKLNINVICLFFFDVHVIFKYLSCGCVVVCYVVRFSFYTLIYKKNNLLKLKFIL